MADAHQHCSCNGVWLCPTCHAWCHAHPFEAKADGFIVSRYSAEPGEVEVTGYFGTILLRCDGLFDLPPIDPRERTEQEA